MTAALVSAAVGLWLMAAPAVLGYGGASADSDRVVGPLVATFAIAAASQSTRSVRWVNLLPGAWLILSPAWLGGPWTAAVNSVLSGIAVVALSTVRGRLSYRMGGGWGILFK